MRKIPLGRKNKFAYVDNDDYSDVAHFQWHESVCGAAQRRPYRAKKKKGCIFLHHVLLGLKGNRGKTRVVHKNGNRLDCRRCNMVVVRK